jgi:predicted nucleotidyltransferase
MTPSSDTRAKGEAILVAAVELAREQWRERLAAAYALGSLAHGGFSTVSDIDLGLVLSDPLLADDATGMARLTDSIKATRKPFADRLSVFWGSMASLSGRASGGRFPPLDRVDLKKYGRLLAGRDIRDRVSSPGPQDLLTAGAELALRRLASEEAIALLKNPTALIRSGQKTLTRMILWPVRFLFTARTGDVGRNDAAVEHFAAGRDDAPAVLVRMALAWRDSGPQPADRQAIGAITAGLLPLYECFLLDHEPRLRACDRIDLADAFREWRHRLLDK